MTVHKKDLFSGSIIWLDPAVLNAHDQCLAPESPVPPKQFLRPFLCYWRRPGVSAWLPLTTQQRTNRFEVLRRWIRHAFGRLRDDRSFIADFRTCYRGQDEAFLAAAARENIITGPRPCIDTDALETIRREVQYHGGFYI